MRILLTSAAAGLAAVTLSACHSAPAAPPPPPIPLSDSAIAAIRWVESHAVPFAIADSVASSEERAKVAAIVGDARVVGFSELTEGTAQFTNIIRRTLFGLAASSNVRGLAIQASMAEAMDVDRYVRTGVGDRKRLLHALGDWRWESRGMQSLVAAIRAYDDGKPADQQIGFYGFEIPTAAHAIRFITSLGDSVTGKPLGQWLRTQYNCVAANESAHWGLEGRVADSSYWNGCRPLVGEGLDSIVALRKRLGPTSPSAANLAFAEQLARLVQHHVTVGLERLPRHELNAEHVIYLQNLLGPNAKLMVWGGDIEMGRLTQAPNTIQTAVALGEKLGEKYRAVAFAFGDGAVHVRRPATGRSASNQPSGLTDVTVRLPAHETFEDVFRRVPLDAYWLDMRHLPSDNAGAWLKGPRPVRLISDIYAPELPELFLTPLEFPKFFDAVVFVKHVTPERQ
ncbi:MAG: erythromycin esterase family protein [Gemmatimonadaceae bacterium]